MNINPSSLDIAYCFLHQKLQVYAHSTMSWQRDDIEVAIEDYVKQMNVDLYRSLAGERTDFLLDHGRFEADLREAITRLEERMQNNL